MRNRPNDAASNLFLDKLPDDTRRRLAGRMERVKLPTGEMVAGPDEPLRYAYFPVTSILSSQILLRNGTVVEAAAIGYEGMTGIALLVDEREGPYRVVQLVEGETLRVRADDFRAVLAESRPLRELAERYLLTLLRQTAQNAACNLHHPTEERVCRWLLHCVDKMDTGRCHVTQDFLAEMLGTSRQSVSAAARGLRRRGLITYSRGDVCVTDRERLERLACECYEANHEVYDGLMRLPRP